MGKVEKLGSWASIFGEIAGAESEMAQQVGEDRAISPAEGGEPRGIQGQGRGFPYAGS
jgi:hypothetical protein